MKKTVLPLILALLLLTGCGGNPATGPEQPGPTPDPAETTQAAPSDAPSVDGLADAASGVFTFVLDDATGDIVLPAEGPQDVEDLRTELAEDDVTYARVTVQNPDDGLPLEIDAVTVSTPEGQELEFRAAATVIEEWGAAANNGEPNPEVVGLVEEYSGAAVPGSTTDLLMIGGFPDIPDTISAVTVQPAGGAEPVEALVQPES